PFVKIRRTDFAEAGNLGPLTFDDRTGRLFVADPLRGSIYAVDIQTRAARLFAEGLGEPRALSADAPARRVLVADPQRQTGWAIPTDTATVSKNQVYPFAALKQFVEPTALAVSPDGTVWVGDSQANAVFKLDSKGTLISRLVPPKIPQFRR